MRTRQQDPGRVMIGAALFRHPGPLTSRPAGGALSKGATT